MMNETHWRCPACDGVLTLVVDVEVLMVHAHAKRRPVKAVATAHLAPTSLDNVRNHMQVHIDEGEYDE